MMDCSTESELLIIQMYARSSALFTFVSALFLDPTIRLFDSVSVFSAGTLSSFPWPLPSYVAHLNLSKSVEMW